MSTARSKRDRNGTPSSSSSLGGADGDTSSGNDGYNNIGGTPADENDSNSSSSSAIFNRMRSDSTSMVSDISPSNDLNTRRGGKRAKYISPTDRKAFYSIVSLLIDKTTIPSNEIVTIDNWEKFISADKMNYVEKLKDILQYDC